MRDYRSSDRSRDVVAVERGIVVDELRSRPEVLVREIIARKTVKLIRPRFGGHSHLNGACASVVHVERVHLDAGLLNSIGIGYEVQHARPNVAGYIQTVNDEHVAVTASSVRARINLGLCGEVIYR